MTALPLDTVIGSIKEETNKNVTICGYERAGNNRTKLVLQGQDPVTILLPYEIVKKYIHDFYDNIDAPEMDLTKEAIAKIRKDNRLEDVGNFEIGEYVKGKGIFAGTWEPKDRKGNSLNKTFNLYAARNDIGELKTFDDTVKHVAGIKDLEGHDGFNHIVKGKAPDEALYDALRSGTYAGEWFIPTNGVLNGNLYKNRDKGELKGTFFNTIYNGSDSYHWYWSCAEHHGFSDVWKQSFAKGNGGWNRKDGCSLSGRLLRAELRL